VTKPAKEETMRAIHLTDSPRSAQAAKWQNWVTLCAGVVEFILACIPGMISRNALGKVMGVVLIAEAIWALIRQRVTWNLIIVSALAALMIILGLVPHCLGTTGWLIGVIMIVLVLWHLYELTHPLRPIVGQTTESSGSKSQSEKTEPEEVKK
jgi:hypothetical protein